jgi:hypothetical protein
MRSSTWEQERQTSLNLFPSTRTKMGSLASESALLALMLTSSRSTSSRASTPRSTSSTSPLMLHSGLRAWVALGRSQQLALNQAAIRGGAPALQIARGRQPLNLHRRTSSPMDLRLVLRHARKV